MVYLQNKKYEASLAKAGTESDHKVIDYARLDSEIIALEGKISSLKTNNNLLQIKISSLQNLSSNSDLVDEQIRNVLGYGKSNEYIIFFDK